MKKILAYAVIVLHACACAYTIICLFAAVGGTLTDVFITPFIVAFILAFVLAPVSMLCHKYLGID